MVVTTQSSTTDLPGLEEPIRSEKPPPSRLRLLLRDLTATAALLFLVAAGLIAFVGAQFPDHLGTTQNLALSNIRPFDLEHGWSYVLGSDALGRSMLGRLIVAAQTSFAICIPTVLLSSVIGSLWGTWAGYHRGWRETVSMRVADVILSFPSLLLAVVILFILSPSAANIVLILTITRIPVYLRTARAEAAELRSRVFVDAARTFGAKKRTIIRRHLVPSVLPTLVTVATLDFGYVMLAESSLSFLGIGVQAPDVSLGLMVADGRQYLQTSWWLSVLPGLVLIAVTVSLNLLAAWLRIVNDPGQRWRLEIPVSRRRSADAMRTAERTDTSTVPEAHA
ncbi:MAG: binding-protein-dependent transport system inner rane component [Nocardioides sp.]|jgi:peptide/nickel transport system permease protein|nr:binding-protein-dependent transport system inner rane component [Nocardioides sp.]